MPRQPSSTVQRYHRHRGALGPALIAAWLAISAARPAIGRAEPLPLESRLVIGRPAGAVQLSVWNGDDGQTMLRAIAGAHHVEVAIAAGPTDEASIESVTIADDTAVAVVRIMAAPADGPSADRRSEPAAAALVIAQRGRPSIPWIGRLAVRGAGSEQQSDALEIGDRTGDGLPEIIVGMRRPAVRPCGNPAPILSPRALDPATLSLRPVELRWLPHDGDEETVTASTTSPGPAGRALIPALRPIAVSSDAHANSPGAALMVDGDPTTFWSEGQPGAGRWEFATFALDTAGRPLRAVSLVLSPQDRRIGAQLGRPHSFWLIGDGGRRLRVEVPMDALETPGRPLWVVPTAPLEWRCLSVVLDEAYPRQQLAAHTAIAEIEAFSDLDFGGGIADLIADLAEDRPSGGDSARLLASLGHPAILAIVDAWPTLGSLGRRRSIRVLRDNAANDADAVGALSDAADDEDETVRAEAVAAMEHHLPATEDALVAVIERGGLGARSALLALARGAPTAAIPLCLGTMVEADGELRRALRVAVERRGDGAAAPLEAFLSTPPPAAAAANVAVALAGLSSQNAVVTALLEGATATADEFADRYRLVLAAAQIPPTAAITAWLRSLVAHSEHWMLRREALMALAAQDGPGATSIALHALQDAYPRVRVAAVRVLASSTFDAIAQRAQRDRWPMVRARAVAALAPSPAHRPVLRAAIEDDAKVVRAAAIATLASVGERDAATAVLARLADEDEWPEVIDAALDYVQVLCLEEAFDALEVVIRRGSRVQAWAPDVDAAAHAVIVADALGGPRSRELLRMAERDGAPPAVQAAARSLRSRGRPGRGQCDGAARDVVAPR